MEQKEILDLVFSLRADVWQNWGILTSANAIVWGWVIQRHGLYTFIEKLVATLGYSFLIGVILIGMNKSYIELDATADELAHQALNTPANKRSQIAPNGIIEYFISKSPTYCIQFKASFASSINCSRYSEHYTFGIVIMLFCWLITIILFWYERMWLKARNQS